MLSLVAFAILSVVLSACMSWEEKMAIERAVEERHLKVSEAKYGDSIVLELSLRDTVFEWHAKKTQDTNSWGCDEGYFNDPRLWFGVQATIKNISGVDLRLPKLHHYESYNPFSRNCHVVFILEPSDRDTSVHIHPEVITLRDGTEWHRPYWYSGLGAGEVRLLVDDDTFPSALCFPSDSIRRYRMFVKLYNYAWDSIQPDIWVGNVVSNPVEFVLVRGSDVEE